MHGMPPVRRAGKAGIKNARFPPGASVYVIYTLSTYSVYHIAPRFARKNLNKKGAAVQWYVFIAERTLTTEVISAGNAGKSCIGFVIAG